MRGRQLFSIADPFSNYAYETSNAARHSARISSPYRV